MSEMVERVARAMAVKDKGGDYLDVMSEDGDGYGYVGKNEYRAMAKAAIEAMRDLPASATMDSDGCQRWDWNCQTCGGPKENWQMVIDSALSTPAPTRRATDRQ